MDDRRMGSPPPPSSAMSGDKRNVSFSERVTTYEVPALSPFHKKRLFYDQNDLNRFKVQERNRLDDEASDALFSMMGQGKQSSPTMMGSYSPFVF
jgi:hypothetical protein